MLPISIVIPTYNRAQLLTLLLPTYLSQRCAEIIIVDDASSPPVAEVLQQLAQSLQTDTGIKIIRNPTRQQQPRSRMIGVSHSTQPFIFFGEDDAYLSDEYIYTLFSYILEGVADIVATTWIVTERFNEDTSFRYEEAHSVQQLIDYHNIHIFSWKRVRSPIIVPWLHTLALMPKVIVERIGFDPAYKGNAYREETDFYLSAYKEGIKLAFVPGPPAFHYKGPGSQTGGQHPKGDFLIGLLWYEYYSVRNNFYFLKKHQRTLQQLGCVSHPLFGTASFMFRRARGYAGRLIHAVHNRLKG